MTRMERLFLWAAYLLATDPASPDSGPKADAKYALENFTNPARRLPEGEWKKDGILDMLLEDTDET